MGNAQAVAATREQRAQRLQQVRDRMRQRGLDAYIVRGTDRYLNEYVPTAESTRAWLSGFTGSVADLVITPDKAYIFVDGRYYLQGEQETDPAHYQVVKVPLGTANESSMYVLLRQLAGQGVKQLGYEPDRFSVADLAAMRAALDGSGLSLTAVQPSLVEEVRGSIASSVGKLRAVPVSIAGRSVEDKLAVLRQELRDSKLDAMVLQALDEIAYLVNLRGDEIAFQATFKAVAVVTSERLVLALPGRDRGRGLELPEQVTIVDEAAWGDALPTARQPCRVGFDEGSTTEAVRAEIARRGATPISHKSPLRTLKAHKNEAEFGHMLHAYRLADKVIWATQGWFNRRIDGGQPTTEHDLKQEVIRRFRRSGGKGLSFEVIAGAGPHGAIIHYTEADATTPIAPGTLVLLDTGAFYDGGYATDLTRTFLAGKKAQATPRQRLLFTVVLKGAVNAMLARLPVGTKGYQLDAICRAPIWQAGFQYLHGTGHGVGINVHEMPPRVSPIGDAALEPGHVFSIEPGIYVEGECGVRIENLCTVVPDPARAGFLRVVPITFSPLDRRLIEPKLLDKRERAFLAWMQAQWRQELTALPVPLAID
ncbi:MAG: M24 family metallopeptidase [Deltaproteobacteria bacterium]|nr:M24 family metallopeptidase [Deltaproteobacteria bacterium]